MKRVKFSVCIIPGPTMDMNCGHGVTIHGVTLSLTGQGRLKPEHEPHLRGQKTKLAGDYQIKDGDQIFYVGPARPNGPRRAI